MKVGMTKSLYCIWTILMVENPSKNDSTAIQKIDKFHFLMIC